MNPETYKALKESKKSYAKLFPKAKKGSPCIKGRLSLKTNCSNCTATNYGLDCCNNPVGDMPGGIYSF
jgi:hypothetical protein